MGKSNRVRGGHSGFFFFFSFVKKKTKLCLRSCLELTRQSHLQVSSSPGTGLMQANKGEYKYFTNKLLWKCKSCNIWTRILHLCSYPTKLQSFERKWWLPCPEFRQQSWKKEKTQQRERGNTSVSGLIRCWISVRSRPLLLYSPDNSSAPDCCPLNEQPTIQGIVDMHCSKSEWEAPVNHWWLRFCHSWAKLRP